MIKAVLFDFNGVIMDDLEAVARADCGAIHALGGRRVSPDEWFRHIRQDWTAFFMECGVKEADLPKANLIAAKHYPYNTAYVRLVPHVREVLSELKKRKIALGILSGCNRDIILTNLRKFDLESFFSYILAHQDLERQKPHPEGLQKSIQNFGLRPDEILYVDDMPSIFSEAKKLGMRTVGFTSRISGDLSAADEHIDDLREILALVK